VHLCGEEVTDRKPAQVRTEDAIMKTLAQAEKLPPGDPGLKERPPGDPFGLQEERGPLSDAALMRVVQRMIAFFDLLLQEFKPTPHQAVFMMEYTALAVYNDKNCPLTPMQVKAARDQAVKAYLQNNR
jgi:hypothetical protein